MIKEITTREAFNLIDGTQEEIPISGMYVKLNNEKRNFSGILNKPNPNSDHAGNMKYNPTEYRNIVYWDNQANNYRTIKSDNLREFVLDTPTYIVINPYNNDVTFKRTSHI